MPRFLGYNLGFVCLKVSMERNLATEQPQKMEQTQPDRDVYLSVVAPAQNEAENLPRFIAETTEALESLGREYELIVVDDGSTDQTESILRDAMAECICLRVLSFGQRAGKSAAWQAGFRAARGQFIATIDADLQNDPKDIPRMLSLIDAENCDMVNAWRENRDDPWLRLISSRIANGVRNWLTHENIRDSASGLKLFKRRCVENVKLFDGLHRFLPTLVKNEGFRVIEMPVNHRPRSAGKAKYGLWNRVFKALRDAFAVRWMRRCSLRYEVKEWERPNA